MRKLITWPLELIGAAAFFLALLAAVVAMKVDSLTREKFP